jgi:hypothetical protein
MICDCRFVYRSIDARLYFWEDSMNSIPADLLELQARFAHWRATRKYKREAIPDELRNAALEIARRYPLSLVRRVLKLDPARLKNKQQPKHFSRATVRKSPSPAFFKLPDPAAFPSQCSTSHSPVDCRLVLERPDGSRLTLTLPAFDASAIKSICADFLRDLPR